MRDSIINASQVLLNSHAEDKNSVLSQLADLMERHGLTAPGYGQSLLERENVSNTYLGHGIAIPHGMVADRHLVLQTGIVVVQLPQGLAWNPGEQVHLAVGIAARSDEHLAILRRLTRLMQDESQLQTLFHTSDPHLLAARLSDTAHTECTSGESEATAADFALTHAWQLDYPNGLHARPASLWVRTARQFPAQLQIRHGADTADAKHLIGLLQLGLEAGDSLVVSAQGEQAQAALDALLATMQALSSAEIAAAQQTTATPTPPAMVAPENTQQYQGIGASPGLTVGPTQRWLPTVPQVADLPGSLHDGGAQLEQALHDTAADLVQQANDNQVRLGAQAADIFRAQATLLSDSALLTACCSLMAQGHGVAWSWHQAINQQAEALAAHANPLLAMRAADLRDAGLRVLQRLQPDMAPSVRRIDQPCILLADDLAPSDTARLDPNLILGLCTARGGPTSHTAILARTLGLPALVGGGEALLHVADGSMAILDGQHGTLSLTTDAAALAQARDAMAQQAAHRAQAQQLASAPACTQDGQRIEIGANINRADQVAGALHAGAEGVGLMRTEFLFLQRDQAPDEEEQYQAYRAMLEALQGRPLIVRALDIGGDKQAPWLTLPAEDNPFLGIRGARLLLRHPTLLQTQMRALYRAAAHGPLSVMFPMVSTVRELQLLRQRCETWREALHAPAIALGVMIEVPAAAVMADQLAQYADFFSIGTNDLTQYVLAMDRQHPSLAAEADALQPAVLRMIQQTVQGARTQNIPVGVCGALAGDPLGAAILCGLGVRELSMSPGDVAAVKARLAASPIAALQSLAQRALACDDANTVRALAEGQP